MLRTNRPISHPTNCVRRPACQGQSGAKPNGATRARPCPSLANWPDWSRDPRARAGLGNRKLSHLGSGGLSEKAHPTARGSNRLAVRYANERRPVAGIKLDLIWRLVGRRHSGSTDWWCPIASRARSLRTIAPGSRQQARRQGQQQQQRPASGSPIESSGRMGRVIQRQRAADCGQCQIGRRHSTSAIWPPIRPALMQFALKWTPNAHCRAGLSLLLI